MTLRYDSRSGSPLASRAEREREMDDRLDLADARADEARDMRATEVPSYRDIEREYFRAVEDAARYREGISDPHCGTAWLYMHTRARLRAERIQAQMQTALVRRPIITNRSDADATLPSPGL